ELARANATEAGATNVEFRKGTIEEVPLPDASVDVVISNCVINLSVDKPRVLAEMFRVLVPGGRIGVSDVVAEDHLTPRERAERARPRRGAPGARAAPPAPARASAPPTARRAAPPRRGPSAWRSAAAASPPPAPPPPPRGASRARWPCSSSRETVATTGCSP